MKKCIEVIFELENDGTINFQNFKNYLNEKKLINELIQNKIINKNGVAIRPIVKQKIYYTNPETNKNTVKLLFYEKIYTFPFAYHHRN